MHEAEGGARCGGCEVFNYCIQDSKEIFHTWSMFLLCVGSRVLVSEDARSSSIVCLFQDSL